MVKRSNSQRVSNTFTNLQYKLSSSSESNLDHSQLSDALIPEGKSKDTLIFDQKMWDNSNNDNPNLSKFCTIEESNNKNTKPKPNVDEPISTSTSTPIHDKG